MHLEFAYHTKAKLFTAVCSSLRRWITRGGTVQQTLKSHTEETRIAQVVKASNYSLHMLWPLLEAQLVSRVDEVPGGWQAVTILLATHS